jgi:alanine-glyoxylate transaminase/serine-glyoxylate transaminase/serine-pyruvate transaminase
MWNPEHLDPAFLEVCDAMNSRLRCIFGTNNISTFTGFGTGSNGIETMLANCLEPGEKVMVIKNGVFGARAAEMSQCYGIEPIIVEFEFGSPLDLHRIEEALEAASSLSAIFFVLAETSNGIAAPGKEISALVRKIHPNALVLVDAVTAIGGIEIAMDSSGFDVVSAGSQKCLSVPTGLFPISYSPRALAKIESRTSPIPSWSHNPLRLAKYLGQTGSSEPRRYVTTAETTLVCQMAESTALIMGEGLEQVWERHALCGKAFRAGAQALGLELRAPEGNYLPMLHPLKMPAGIDPKDLRSKCLKAGVSFGGGLGDWSHDSIRVGLMGHGAREDNVLLALKVLASALDIDSENAQTCAKEYLA